MSGSLSGGGGAAPPKPLIKTRQVAVTIDGVHTDIVLTVFSNCIMCVVTQREKIGHMFECHCDGGFEDTETYTVNALLGSRGGVEEVFARQIIAALSRTTQRHFIIGLAMKEKEPPISTLHGVLSALKANVFWKG